MDEPMLTIPLREYNELRDKADLNALMIEKISFFESRMMDLEKRMCDQECKNR